MNNNAQVQLRVFATNASELLCFDKLVLNFFFLVDNFHLELIKYDKLVLIDNKSLILLKMERMKSADY